MDRDDRLELFHPDRPDEDLPGAGELGRQYRRSAKFRGQVDAVNESDRRIREALNASAPPAGLRERVLGAVAAKRRQGRRRVMRWSAVAATAAMIGLVVWRPFAVGPWTFDQVGWEAARVFEAGDFVEDEQPEAGGQMALVGFSGRFVRSTGWVRLLGVDCRACRLESDRHRALVIFLPKERFAPGVEANNYDIPFGAGLSVVFIDAGDHIAAVVIDGTKQDLAPFRSRPSLT